MIETVERRTDARPRAEAPKLAELTETDWSGFSRVVDAMAHEVWIGHLVIQVSNGRACDLRKEARVHLQDAENVSGAAVRLFRGSNADRR
jgi:hypothetical protein